MSDDRTAPPSPVRRRRAWDAGMRPWSGWLWPAVACGFLALGIGRMRDEGRGPGLELDVGPGAVTPEAWLGSLVDALGSLLAAVGIAVVGLALVSQRLGWVSGFEQERLLPAPARPAMLSRIVLCAVVGTILVLALAGSLAGSARAVDASEAGLALLWLGWAQRALGALALALGLGAIVELLLDRRDRTLRLWQTPQAARDEVRAGGGPSR